MNASSQNQSQATAATALVQLLQQHPEHPKVAWRVPDHDPLIGSLHGSLSSKRDVVAAVAAWAGFLGVEPRRTPFVYEGVERVELSVETVWRDVPVSVHGSCLVSALAERVSA